MRRRNKFCNIISILLLFTFTFTFQQTSYAYTASSDSYQNIAADSKLPGDTINPHGDTLTEEGLHREAREAGIEEDETPEQSGIELTERVDVQRRLQFARLSLDPKEPPTVEYEEMTWMMHHSRQDFEAMITQMRSVLEAAGQDIGEVTSGQVIHQFLEFAIPKIRTMATPLATNYGLDPLTTIVLEWGSRRPAHFRRRGKWGQEIILNINLLIDDIILEGETLHEVLHPLVRPWLEYVHSEAPQIFEIAGIEVRRGIRRPVKEGYIANVWDWEFKKDNVELLMEGIQTMNGSEDQKMKEEGQKMYGFVNKLLEENLKALRVSSDEKSQAAASVIENRRAQASVPIKIEILVGLLRETLDGLEASLDANDRARSRELNKRIREELDRIVKSMSGSTDSQVQQKAANFQNTLKGIALREVLIEVFILQKELEFFDANREHTIGVFEDNKNILDRGGKFANLLKLEGDERLSAIIQHVSDRELYSTKPELAIGGSILSEIWQRDAGVIKSVLRGLDERLAASRVLELEPPENMDGVLDRIETHEVELIKVKFTDPQGRLMGQVKTVLMPVNKATKGLFQGGVSFDGSSITTSVSIDGAPRPLGEIFASDFIARFVPGSLRISKERGVTVASIDAEAKVPMENIPHQITRRHEIKPRQMVSVSRELARTEAEAKVIRTLEHLGLKKVNLLLNDWTEELTMVPVEVSQLDVIFGEGTELSEKDAKFLPTLESKEGFRVVPDPYSLSLIRYADGSIEAVMAVEIQDMQGQPFEGDFRRRLKNTVEEAEKRGFIPYMAPEPEVFFFRRLEDGSLVTADAGRYYDDLTHAPSDLQDVFKEIIMAAESAGVTIRYIHHEVAPGQYEIPYEYGSAFEVADKTVLYMHIVKEVAKRHGLEACFMPKPVDGENGSGMHIHQSLLAAGDMTLHGREYKEGNNVFFDPEGKFKLSKTAEHYIGGLLKYAPGILRITNPDQNSYLRLIPGYEAPTNLVYGFRNRSAAVRVPEERISAATRIEYRVGDPSGCIHAKFYAILEAGLQGVKDDVVPPEPVEEVNVFILSDEEKTRMGIVELPGGPGGLDRAIALMNSPQMAPLVNRVIGEPDSDLRKFLSQPTDLYAAGAVRLARSEGDTTAVDDGAHAVINEVLRVLLNLPVGKGTPYEAPPHTFGLNKCYVIAANDQEVGSFKIETDSTGPYEEILSDIKLNLRTVREKVIQKLREEAKEELGKAAEEGAIKNYVKSKLKIREGKALDDPDANIIIVPDLEKVCEAQGVSGIVSHEGHGIAGPEGRSVYIDDARFTTLMRFGNNKEKVQFFVHLITHLDNPIRDGESAKGYEARIEALAPTQEARVLFARVDRLKERQGSLLVRYRAREEAGDNWISAYAELGYNKDSAIAATKDSEIAELLSQERYDGRHVAKKFTKSVEGVADAVSILPVRRCGLLFSARYILRNIGAREVLEELVSHQDAEGQPIFTVVVEVEDAEEQKVVEALGLPNVRITAPEAEETRQQRIDRINRVIRDLVRKDGILPQHICVIADPHENPDQEANRLNRIINRAIGFDVWIGVPEALAGDGIISMRKVFGEALDAVAGKKGDDPIAFKIKLPAIEMPSELLDQEMRQINDEFREAIEFLKKA